MVLLDISFRDKLFASEVSAEKFVKARVAVLASTEGKTNAPPPPPCSFSFRASPALNNIEIWFGIRAAHHSFNCNLYSHFYGVWERKI